MVDFQDTRGHSGLMWRLNSRASMPRRRSWEARVVGGSPRIRAAGAWLPRARCRASRINLTSYSRSFACKKPGSRNSIESFLYLQSCIGDTGRVRGAAFRQAYLSRRYEQTRVPLLVLAPANGSPLHSDGLQETGDALWKFLNRVSFKQSSGNMKRD